MREEEGIEAFSGLAVAQESFLVVVDVQPKFMSGMYEAQRVVRRTEFLARLAHLLGVPVIATEQNPERMGSTDPALAELVGKAIPKMRFSCTGVPAFDQAVERMAGKGRNQAVLVGIETHICVSQTAMGLIEMGFDVLVGVDALSARTIDRHEVGLARLRDVGVSAAHTESIAYEWLEAADHPKFRDALDLVKRFA